MTPNFKKTLKTIGEILGIFVIGLLAMSLAGKFFIEEISQPLFVESQVEGGVLESGRNAPYFELHNLKGKLVKLTDYKDIPLVLIFWNTWSDASKNQIKIIDDLLKSEEIFFKVVAVNSQEDRRVVSSFIDRGLYSIPEILLDFNGSVSDLYEARNLPSLYFIDKEGLLRDTKLGVLSEREIVDNMAKFSN